MFKTKKIVVLYPVIEVLLVTLWASAWVCEPVVSKLEIPSMQRDLRNGSSACSLGLLLKCPDSICGGPYGLL